MSLYAQLRAAGCVIDHHESDLYVEATPEALTLILASGCAYSAFQHQILQRRWYDVPFAYEPWWQAKGRSSSGEAPSGQDGPSRG